MIPVTLGQFLPALPEGGRSSLTATVVRGMAMTIQLARFTADDDAGTRADGRATRDGPGSRRAGSPAARPRT
jgi:hypothetical protein